MKKSIKGRKWKKDSPQKTVLNEVLSSKEIIFLEKETKDMVYINFSLKENQYGMYAEEYIPNTLTPDGHKKADITAFILDEDAQKGKYYVADVKSDVGGRDVIFHLCEQWQAGLKYLNHTVVYQLDDDFDMEKNLMVITRNFDIERIKKELNSEKKKIQDMEKYGITSLPAAKLYAQQAVKIKKECEVLEKFVEKKFYFQDRSEIKEYLFKVGKLEKVENDTYVYHLYVTL